MAQRRMFSKQITESDAFLDMPASTQCLYFHLNMAADDDGFVNSPKRVMRNIGASQDDMNLLIAKKFVLLFESGVIVIKHWRMNNYLRNDRYRETDYKDEKSQLDIKENGSYKLVGYQMDTVGIPNGNPGKDRIGKDRIGKDIAAANAQARVEVAQAVGTAAAAAGAIPADDQSPANWAALDMQEIKNAFESEICKAGNHVAHQMVERYNALGKDLMLEIIHEAARNNGKSWVYVDRIIQRCIEAGISDINAFKLDREAKAKKPYARDRKTKSIVKSGKYDGVFRN